MNKSNAIIHLKIFFQEQKPSVIANEKRDDSFVDAPESTGRKVGNKTDNSRNKTEDKRRKC
jgi:hypothetical protein